MQPNNKTVDVSTTMLYVPFVLFVCMKNLIVETLELEFVDAIPNLRSVSKNV